ncbi:MAG: sulfurtransferase [Chloroflexi bacterium]|nr:MAG: sulfurtransferase [Chloroflexota bacterium]
MSGYARPELLASTEWLADNLGRPEVRVVDVRWRPDGSGRQVHSTGHVPGAAYLDWANDLVDTDDEAGLFLLAPPDKLGRALANVGVGDGTTVVLYDDTMALFAGRAWWSLRAYGFDSTRVLDGGYLAWLAEDRPVSSAQPSLQHATFTPRAQLRLRLTTSDIRGLLGSPDLMLLDARAPAEYRGLEGNTRRLGHIPGAINVPVGAMNRPGDQRFRDGEELRAQLLRANVTRGRRMVCYDGSGVGAAKLAFVLTLLGYDDVAVYDGGWAEWGDRLDLPVDR